MSKKIATREAYGKALAELAKENENVIVLDADLSKSTKTADFKEQSPQFNLDVRATNIAMLCNPIPTHRIGNADLKKSPIIMK